MSTQTDLTRDDLKKLVKTAAQKERRIVRSSIVFSLAALCAGVLWLWYASNRVAALDAEYAARLEAQELQLKEKSKELNAMTAAVEAKQKELTQAESKLQELQTKIQTLTQFSVQALSAQRSNDDDESLLARYPKAAILLPRVYLRFHTEEQQTKANAIARDLQKQGFSTPPTQIVKGRGPQYTTIHFYRKSEEAEATQIAELLQRSGAKALVKYVEGHEDSTRMRARHYEVFFGSDF